MYLASFLNNLIKQDGFILIDADKNKYIIGSPIKENPVILKLLDKKLHYKLLFYSDLFLYAPNFGPCFAHFNFDYCT